MRAPSTSAALGAIKPELDAIAAMKSIEGNCAADGECHVAVWRDTLFGAGSAQDPDNSEQEIADLDQGGLGLPDRDYYTKEDDKSKEIRERYLQHVQASSSCWAMRRTPRR